MKIITRLGMLVCLAVPAHGAIKEAEMPLYTHNINTAGDEGREPNLEMMSQLLTNSADGKDIMLFVGGKLKDEFFLFNRCFTLRDDYGDQNDFIRHKLQLDSTIVQGVRKYGKPASQAAVRLTNYMLWQDAGNYTPLYIEKLELPGADNAVLANDIQVKSVLPLLFVEEAWFKLNVGTFAKPCKGQDTFLKIGYFPYQVGRGVSMGLHGDLAVDYLGWGGEGGYSRFPAAPPGILWHQEINKKLSIDAYFNLWRETNASIRDTQKTTKKQWMDGSQPQRGGGNDTWSFALRADYLMEDEDAGSALLQPYGVYTRAPEQMIEVLGDAKSDLFTVGTMVDWKKNNLTINIEAAIQFGHQDVLPLDRNTYTFGVGATGALGRGFSHIQQVDAIGGVVPPAPDPLPNVAEQSFQAAGEIDIAAVDNPFDPNDNLSKIVLAPENRVANVVGPTNPLTRAGAPLQVLAGLNNLIFNSNIFGNSRFRKGYRLENRGVMFMADAIYDFEDKPVSVAGAIGYISGDNYPYNDETSRIFRGFIPQRSRYRGYGVKSWLMFERQIIPRPINISYRTLSAYNNLKDLSNLQFFGIGATWFPFKKRSRGHVGADVMVLGEVASLNKWDVHGKHPDPAIERQLERLRNTPAGGQPTLFSGWESAENASRYLGLEIDFRAHYNVLENCDLVANLSFFIPGTLYSDLKGQPNILTQRIDKDGFLRYDSLGDKTALGFMIGFHYAF